MKILVVDDDKNFTLTLCQILSLEGYSCHEAHSCNEAELILKKEKFDLILSDMRMPKDSGLTLYNRIKNKMPNIPFILMTAYSSNEDIEEALQSGILTALSKPINIQNILAFLSKLNRGLYAAIVCDNEIPCRLIIDFLESKNLKYKKFENIRQLIKTKVGVFSIIFIDAHHPCEYYRSDIIDLFNILPKKTVVVICDYEISEKNIKNDKLPHNLNLIVLPRQKKMLDKLDSILDREFYRFAEKQFSREIQ